MFKHLRNGEQGQALAIMALALIALLAFAALAIDGGNAYTQRRIAQKAADGGSMAGATNLIEPGANASSISAAVYEVAAANGINADDPSIYVGIWYSNSYGEKLQEEEIHGVNGGAIPSDARGIHVVVRTQFSAFVAGLIGRESLEATSDASAVAEFSNFCAQWVLYANCADGTGNCNNAGLHLSGSNISIIGGGIHSNSGLHLPASGHFSLPNGVAEWGPEGTCTGGYCPPGGLASQVSAPSPMPQLYKASDFFAADMQSGGGHWWNTMCQGEHAVKCRFVNGGLGASDVISGGLTVVNGDVNNPAFFNPAQVKYTIVATGKIKLSGQGLTFEPFVGSSSEGGSKLLFMTLASGSQGIEISGSDVHFTGTIYAPVGEVNISASGTLGMQGQIFGHRVDLTGANIEIIKDTYFCPAERAKVKLIK